MSKVEQLRALRESGVSRETFRQRIGNKAETVREAKAPMTIGDVLARFNGLPPGRRVPPPWYDA